MFVCIYSLFIYKYSNLLLLAENTEKIGNVIVNKVGGHTDSVFTIKPNVIIEFEYKIRSDL